MKPQIGTDSISSNGAASDATNEQASQSHLLAEQIRPLVEGVARFVDDISLPEGTLHAAIVASQHPHARILNIDTSEATQYPGVVAVLTHDDIPGAKTWGPVRADTPVLAFDRVESAGQPIALVVAIARETAYAARALVRVNVEPLDPILDIDAAIEHDSFYPDRREICQGDVEAAFKRAPHGLQGIVRCGGQEHLYLETQASVAIPDEYGNMHVISSSQHPAGVQKGIAHVLGYALHRVICEVPRMGGGFGGKEVQAEGFAILAALAAHHTGRPVKVRLSREDDMRMTGKRHPFRADYRVAFDDHGVLQALDVELTSDAGYNLDLSAAVMERALFHLDNAYQLPACRCVGRLAKTNRSSSTAFRGFGGPQGMFVIETILERIAEKLQLEVHEVRRRNMYPQPRALNPSPVNGCTHYGQTIDDFVLPEIWDRLLEKSEYQKRKDAIRSANVDSSLRRGIGITPVKFGISFTTTFLNQGGALVMAYPDGSLQVNHGGTEMGQGLYAKMQAIAARTMGISIDRVRVMSTRTDKVPNASATAASASTDLNGAAVFAACETLKARLSAHLSERWQCPVNKIKFGAPKQNEIRGNGQCIDFSSLCQAAWLARIELSATGFYRTPDLHFDVATGRGHPFAYFACGAAVTEVELDVHTGEHRVLRCDIIHDVGSSIAPVIDRGQIIGAFAQGLGWVTCEELCDRSDGQLDTAFLSRYKIPTINDLPRDFFVELFEGQHEKAIYGSKAVGEPPFMLALSVWSALRDAIASIPGEAPVELPIPATPQALLRAIFARRGEDFS